ncbi:hypothetical protein EZV62_004547 [Acer yangbiense]|uniref:Uncharacterized protein n=1 Tax=Acer yangbiense TaxID=1000413 RepID=A0A5C7ILW5_9ROSI|nr:hypothetical protein EZV62_004547 [Acer yangbiense]
MGSVISKAANGIGSVLGNAFAAPFKTIFNESSCEAMGLLLFCYLLFQVGICQCIGRSLCKMCWAACETYWYALQDITCFLWHKIKNTKRRNRRRIRDVELGYSSSDGSYFSDKYGHLSPSRKRYRERKKWYGNGSHHHRRRHHHHHRVRGGSIRLNNSRRLQLVKVRNPHRISKRRRFR